MGKATICRMYGDESYYLFRESRQKLIGDIDRRSMIDHHQFTHKQAIDETDLFKKDDAYVRHCYENCARTHLLYLVREGILNCDRSSVPYSHFHTPGCRTNPRVGPDIDYRELFKHSGPLIRQQTEKRIMTASEGTQFNIGNFRKTLEIPYAEVPAFHRKCIRLLTNIFVKFTRSGYLIQTRQDGKPTLFTRTNQYAHPFILNLILCSVVHL